MSLSIMAAGSLRAVWPDMAAAFNQPVCCEFGPAGLLCERLKQGERCDLFLSANTAHPEALLTAGSVLSTAIFSRNQLCLSVKEQLAVTGRSWLDLLCDPNLRVATSTPVSDPSGDYTWQLFERIGQHRPGADLALKQRALQLVGGSESPAIPAGELAASWVLNSDSADIFIGYQSYAPRLRRLSGLSVLTIPPPFQIQADYAFALCDARAKPLADFLLSAQAQKLLQKAGFQAIAG